MEVYRVRREFCWDGWIYAPQGQCKCACVSRAEDFRNNPRNEGKVSGLTCTGQVGSGCQQCEATDHCSCRIPPDRYAGEIWIVMESHPRKEQMLLTRFAVADPSLAPADELVKQPEYKKLLTLWKAPAHRSPGRPPRVADPVA